MHKDTKPAKNDPTRSPEAPKGTKKAPKRHPKFAQMGVWPRRGANPGNPQKDTKPAKNDPKRSPEAPKDTKKAPKRHPKRHQKQGPGFEDLSSPR